jgi:hypothetical protein
VTRGPLSFKETDLMRAIKCAIKAGLQVAGFEITKAGNIMVHTGNKPAEQTEADANPWYKALGQ